MAGTSRHLLIAIGIGIATALGSVAYAVFGEVERGAVVAGALASGGALVVASSALYVSHLAVERAEQQIEEGRKALELSHSPLVVPIHDVGGSPATSGALSKHPPAKEPYALKPSLRADYAFIRDSDGSCSLPVQNVGTGPAVSLCVRLFSCDGLFGESQNRSALVPGGVAHLSVRLSEPLSMGKAPSWAADRYALEVKYQDVFGKTRSTRATFETAGTGAWVISPNDTGSEGVISASAYRGLSRDHR